MFAYRSAVTGSAPNEHPQLNILKGAKSRTADFLPMPRYALA